MCVNAHAGTCVDAGMESRDRDEGGTGLLVAVCILVQLKSVRKLLHNFVLQPFLWSFLFYRYKGVSSAWRIIITASYTVNQSWTNDISCPIIPLC